MPTYAVYLWPQSSFASEGQISSDTLFGAVCWALRILDIVDVGQMLADFESPRFVFSSPFPVRHQEHKVRFFPLPAWVAGSRITVSGRTMRERLRQYDYVEQVTNVRYVSESLFTNLISGDLPPIELVRRYKPRGATESDIVREGVSLLTFGERQSLRKREAAFGAGMQISALQHNMIDRVAGATVEGLLFYTDEIFFARDAGLWSMLHTSLADYNDLILPALRYLQDTGLGGNRSTGKGQFKFDIETFDKPPDAGEQANGWLCLSRYLPKDGEWDPADRPLAYQVENLLPKRERGFPHLTEVRSGPTFKRRVRMFAPGSIFPIKEQKPVHGRLAEVVPASLTGWSVYQSGVAVGTGVYVPPQGGLYD